MPDLSIKVGFRGPLLAKNEKAKTRKNQGFVRVFYVLPLQNRSYKTIVQKQSVIFAVRVHFPLAMMGAALYRCLSERCSMLANEAMYLKCFFQILFCGLTIQILLGLQTMEDRMPNLRANVFHQKCNVDRQTLFL